MDSSKKTVGVVIPFYNGSKFIERALVSVFNQTIKADEIVVVNDGSSQEESLFLRRLEGKYQSRFRVIDQGNQGQGSARNTGVDNLSSEYVCFLDQDDYFIKCHIEELMKGLPQDTSNLGFIYSDLSVIDELGRTLYRNFVAERAEHPKKSIEKLLSEDMYVLPSASMLKRKVFLELGGFDPQFSGYEDDDLFLRLFIAGYENYFVPKDLTVWFINSSSTTFNIRMKRSRYKYFLKLVDTFRDDNLIRRFYFRDIIVGRFLPTFTADVVSELKSPSEHMKEIKSFLIDFHNIVWANKFVQIKTKIKVSILTFILCMTPRVLTLLLVKVKKVTD